MSEAMRKEIDALSAKLDAGLADSRAINRRIIATLVRIEGKVDDIAERMATKDDLSAIGARIHGLSGRIDDMTFRWANHEERITALEKPRRS